MKTRSAKRIFGNGKIVTAEIPSAQSKPAAKKILRKPTAREIERKAYELYANRGFVDGYDLQDWYEAERQLTAAR